MSGASRRWWAYARMRPLSRLAFRADWMLGLAGDAVTAGVGLAMVLALHVHVPTVAGWSREELVVCWGVAESARALFWMGFSGLYVANGTYVVGGGLDRLLLRPLHPLGQILMDHWRPGAWPGVLWGFLAAWLALGGLSVAQVGLFLLGATGGALLLAGVMTALSSVGFWFLHRGSAVGLAWQLTSYAPFPPSFLPWPVALGLTTVLPFAFAGFAPGCWLLERPAPAWTWLQPGVALGFAALGLSLWDRGLRRYGSAGS